MIMPPLLDAVLAPKRARERFSGRKPIPRPRG